MSWVRPDALTPTLSHEKHGCGLMPSPQPSPTGRGRIYNEKELKMATPHINAEMGDFAAERQTTFNDMIKIALESVLLGDKA